MVMNYREPPSEEDAVNVQTRRLEIWKPKPTHYAWAWTRVATTSDTQYFWRWELRPVCPLWQ